MTNENCTCRDCSSVARNIAGGVNPSWAIRQQRETIARLKRIGEGDGVVCPALNPPHLVDHLSTCDDCGAVTYPGCTCTDVVYDLEAPTRRQLLQMQREERSMGNALRSAARRGEF